MKQITILRPFKLRHISVKLVEKKVENDDLPALLVFMKSTPKVSIILPNYNHGRFLPQRLDSIFGQSYQNFELIFLDDASTDNSLEVIAGYVKDKRLSCHVNTTNSGNTFIQWNKGFQLARGEFIWIAESDDYASKNFLETLVTLLDASPRLGLVYSHSFLVDDHGTVSPYAFYNDFFPARWERDFVNNGRDECEKYLCFRNTIPNASAVLLRREAGEAVGGADSSFRMTGDWALWVDILLKYDLAFCAKPLNFYRHHTSTVRARNGVFGLTEKLRILKRIQQNIPLSEATKRKMWEQFLDDWSWSILRHDPDEQILVDLIKETSMLYPDFVHQLLTRIAYRASLTSAYLKELDRYDMIGNDQSLMLAMRLIKQMRSNYLYQRLSQSQTVYPWLRNIFQRFL